MAMNKGKRKRRQRRRFDDDYMPQPAQTASTKSEPKPTRGRKPLAERSPIVPAGATILCMVGAVFTLLIYRPISTVKSHGVITHVTGSPSGLGLILGVFYVVLAVVEGFLTYKIRQARGSWT
jgi:hypothetical protein